MNMGNSRDVVVCKFFKKPNHRTPEKQSFQCYLGNKIAGTLYVVDHHMSLIPEEKIEEGAYYYCGVSKSIGQKGEKFVNTVVVIEKIDFNSGSFFDYRFGNRFEWQCRKSSQQSQYTLIIDKDCDKIPQNTAQYWTFSLKRVVSVEEGHVVISVCLERSFQTENEMKRFFRQEKKRSAQNSLKNTVAA